MNKKTTYVAQAGMIAAVYAAATLITLLALQGLAWGPVQFRISEAVCVLAVLTPAAVPGLTVGCIIANLMALAINGTGALGMLDGVLEAEELQGAKAVLSAAALTYLASVISSALQLLRLILISRSRNRD